MLLTILHAGLVVYWLSDTDKHRTGYANVCYGSSRGDDATTSYDHDAIR